ncbi:MAG: hypothetical protein JNK05_30915 [Myxococcales bacterium]|nr:hypothetical protein [Myxococcales bacterium]
MSTREIDADVEFVSYAERLLAPDNEQADEVRQAAEGCADVRALFESLASRGIVPEAWLDDERREFVADFDAAVGAREGSSLPTSVEAAVVLASDVRGVTTAEALAREIVAGLVSWRVPQPSRVRWWMARESTASSKETDPPATRGRRLDRAIYELNVRWPLRRAYYSLAVAENNGARKAPSIKRSLVAESAKAARCRSEVAEALASDLEASWLWQIATDDGWKYNGVPFAKLSCPFWAILALWKCGYTLVDIHERAVVLGAIVR